MSKDIEKRYITAQDLLQDSFQLGLDIIQSGFRPNYIVGVWRGGTPVGIAIQELLDFAGIKTDHIAIRTSLYKSIGERGKRVRVHGLNYIYSRINSEDSLLIVDDVFDSGLSIDAVIKELHKKCRRNLPHDLRVATPYFKPNNNLTERKPDYYLHETDAWLVFPHELHGLTTEEIRRHKLGADIIIDHLDGV